MKSTRPFAHSGLHHRTYADLEFYVEIMCALANKTAADPQTALPACSSDHARSQRVQSRLQFFHDLYVPSTLPMNLLRFDPPPNELCAAPAPSHVQDWQFMLASFPSKVEDIGELLAARAQHILRTANRSEYFPALIDYASAKWSHKYPDHRADALHEAHYVLLVEFLSQRYNDGIYRWVIQATVHPSQRSTRRHFPRIVYDVLQPRRPFSLHAAQCSCEDGYMRLDCDQKLTHAPVLMAFVRMCRHSCSLFSLRSIL